MEKDWQEEYKGWDLVVRVNEVIRLLKEEEDWSDECNTNQMNQKEWLLWHAKHEGWRVGSCKELQRRKPSKNEEWSVIWNLQMKL